MLYWKMKVGENNDVVSMKLLPDLVAEVVSLLPRYASVYFDRFLGKP